MRSKRHASQIKMFMMMMSATIIIGCSSGNRISTTDDKLGSKNSSQTSKSASGLVCEDASEYLDQVIGDGHCIALIKRCAGAPNTIHWRPGPRVLNNKLNPGTVIATFEGQHYTNQSGQHAAVYIEQDENGIWVWDQWLGIPVHKRLIRIRYDGANASNTAQAYRVVQISD